LILRKSGIKENRKSPSFSLRSFHPQEKNVQFEVKLQKKQKQSKNPPKNNSKLAACGFVKPGMLGFTPASKTQ
jgi:hypothetical protein